MVVLLGRLHPALVHFPIALLLVAGLGLWLPVVRRNAGAEAALRGLFGIGAAAALLAAAAGWLLADAEAHGGAAARLLDLHRWGGVGVAGAATVGALLLHARRGALPVLGRLVALLGGLGVLGVGYLGAEVSEGPGHLWATEAADGPNPTLPQLVALEAPGAKATAGPAAGEPLLFRRDVRPLLRRSCWKCHDGKKQKGGLRLDSRDGMLTGGDDGPALVPGDPDKSLLLARVRLTTDDEDFMPAKGDPLSAEEVALLTRWIAEGGSWD